MSEQGRREGLYAAWVLSSGAAGGSPATIERVGQCGVRSAGKAPEADAAAAAAKALGEMNAGRKKLYEMSPKERLEEALSRKESGREEFSKGNFGKACHMFQAAAVYLRQISDEAVRKEADVDTLIVQCHQNVAMCKIKEGDYLEAAAAASEALAVDPKSVKGLFLRGRAHRLRGAVDLAREDLVAAKDLDAENTDVLRELVALKKSLEEGAAAEKKLFAGVLTEEGKSGASVTGSPRVKRRADAPVIPVQEEKKSRTDQYTLPEAAIKTATKADEKLSAKAVDDSISLGLVAAGVVAIAAVAALFVFRKR